MEISFVCLSSTSFDWVVALHPLLKALQHHGYISVAVILKELRYLIQSLISLHPRVEDDPSCPGNFTESLLQFGYRNRTRSRDALFLELFGRPEIDNEKLFSGIEEKLHAVYIDGSDVRGFMAPMSHRRAQK
jgi:hypothetical protein